jgi:vancomycin resistance protein YoaR
MNQISRIKPNSFLLPAGAVIFAAVLAVGVAGANPAQAAGLTYIGGKYSVTVPDNLKTEWRGTFKVQEISLLHYSHKPIPELVAESLGRESGQGSQYKTYSYNPTAAYQWLEQFNAEINSPLKEGNLNIQNNKVVDFTPPTPGRNLNLYESTRDLLANLESNQPTTDLVVDTVEPGPLSDGAKLGIKELIGHGESKFNGSPRNRRTNIAVGVKKMKGVIVPKGAEFSFNENLGPVEAYAGFVPELVIKAEGTVPELGGGLCQVSSTTFRAAMDAGLPITQRRNHAYAVQYYSPQGTDATIYPGVIDLKFTNDTPGSILIWPYLKDENTLVFDFYGTRDDRQVTLGTPVQYDRKSDGSMKANWTRTIVKDGESNTQTFYSVYKSPALYHKKEEFPAPASPTDVIPNPTLAPPLPTTSENPPATNSNTNSNSNSAND